MKSNEQLGFEQVAKIDCYEIGKNAAGKYRGYGFGWSYDQDSSREGSHHEVCGRGDTAEQTLDALIQAAIRAGEAGDENVSGGLCSGLTEAEALRLQDELREELAELADAED